MSVRLELKNCGLEWATHGYLGGANDAEEPKLPASDLPVMSVR